MPDNFFGHDPIMNILLVYPEFPDTFWSFKHALPFIRKRAAFPPLGVITVGALLPSQWKKRLVDLNVHKLTDDHLSWADYVFISAMTVQKTSVRRIVDRCREAGVKIVGGGPLFTCQPEAFDDLDHRVLNEAEVTLPRFVVDVMNGCAKRVYTTDQFADMGKTPVPMWSLLELKRYATMSIQYSRGCPHQCDFCNVTSLFGHRPRMKAAEQIIRELDTLHHAGWRGTVFFADDNLIGNKKRLKDGLLPALIKWQEDKTGITFHTQVSLNLADDEELMSMMVAAGFVAVFLGIETPDSVSLAECHKTQNQGRDLVADVKRIQRAGMQVQGGFIVGFDSDTPSIFQRQIDFIQQSGIVTAMVGLLQAVPGTRLYERMKRENRLQGDPSGDNVDGRTNIITLMSTKTLYQGYKRILQQIYMPRNYYPRLKTFLQNYRLPEIRPKQDLTRILPFVRSSFRLGVLGKERFHYWRLLFWIFFSRRELLPLAVTLSIFGYHFRKICELHVAPE